MHLKRDEAKKIIKEKIIEKYITYSTDDIKKDNLQVLRYIQMYKQLVFEFGEEFEKLKRNKNLIDFSDFEHLTLKLLRDEYGNPTEIADKVSEEFEEIYIDEYQDCNNIQNTIFNLISGQRRNKPNIFCSWQLCYCVALPQMPTTLRWRVSITTSPLKPTKPK